MEKKKDIIYFCGIILVFLICAILTWGYFGDLYIDCGREAYLPELILKGKVLYKDIFGMYNPFSYQINALLYAIFGGSLNILYLAGLFNAFFIAIATYLISRLFISEFYSFSITLFIIFYYIFSTYSAIDYVFPYAYAFPYALCCFLYFVYFTMLYLRKENKNFIYPAALMLGLSLANKYEFALCIIPFVGLMLYKKESFKRVIVSLILYILPICISWGILFLQGFTVQDLTNYINLMQRFFKTDEQIYYTSLTSYKWDFTNFKSLTFNFILTTIFITIYSFILRLFAAKKTILKFTGLILLFAGSLTYLILNKYIVVNNVSPFSWICLATLITLVFLWKTRHSIEHFALFTMGILAIVSTIRVKFLLFGHGYSIYLILLPLIMVWCTFIIWQNNFLQKYALKRYIAITLIILSAMSFSHNLLTKKTKFNKMTTTKGVIYTKNAEGSVFLNALDYIENNTKPEDVIVMLPESPMINFMTGRETNPLYYHLIPNHISAIGEDNIVEGFRDNPPDYIMLNNTSYHMYGAKYICEDFAFKICNFIDDNYEFQEEFETSNDNKSSFYVKIYKYNH